MNQQSTYQIQDSQTGEDFDCRNEETILRGLVRLGRKGIPVGCRNGGCGVCKIHILKGEYHFKKLSRAHVSEAEEKEGYVLACRCFPDSDLQIKVIGQMGRKRKNQQLNSTNER